MRQETQLDKLKRLRPTEDSEQETVVGLIQMAQNEDPRLEALKKIKGMMQPTAQPEIQQPGTVQDHPYVQAELMEPEAQPRNVQPQGVKENLIAGIQGAFHPQGFQGMMAGKQADEERRQHLLRIKQNELRNQGFQQQQLYRQDQNDANTRDYQSKQLGLSRDQADVNRMNMLSQIKARENPVTAPQRIDPLSPEGIQARVQFEKDKPKPEGVPGAEPGQYIDLRDDQGRVIGAWNPKTGAFKETPVPGARRTGVPGGVNTKITDTESAYRKIVDLGKAYKPSFVGPVEGRVEQSKASGILAYLPWLKTQEGYPEFSALSKDLQNSMIRLITGAQMSEPEAKRILGQVPNETDKDEMWAAKYEETKKNAEFLMQRTKELSGAGGGQAPTQPGGGNADPLGIR